MKFTYEQALQLVPANAPNREKLAQLLVTVRGALADRDALSHAWLIRLQQVGALITIASCAERGSAVANKANEVASAAVEAARDYARRKGLSPNTRQTIRAEARAIYDALGNS